MKISIPFIKDGILNNEFGGYAKNTLLINGAPRCSFPILWEDFHEESNYIHLILVDYDSNPVCGYTFFHWGICNIEKDTYPTGIEQDFSLKMLKKIPQALNSSWNFNKVNKEECTGYYGPFPPNCPHTYSLYAITTKEKLNLNDQWLLNEFASELRKQEIVEWKLIEFIYNNF